MAVRLRQVRDDNQNPPHAEAASTEGERVMGIERLTLGDVGQGCCGTYSTVEPDPLGELVAVKDLQSVIHALHLALAICDQVPSRLHIVAEDGWKKRLGEMVNKQPDGRHGYAAIRDACDYMEPLISGGASA